jgi:hypothetical protein
MLDLGIIQSLVLLPGGLELGLDLSQLILVLLLLGLLLQHEFLSLLLRLLDLLLCARHLSDHPRHLLLLASPRWLRHIGEWRLFRGVFSC